MLDRTTLFNILLLIAINGVFLPVSILILIFMRDHTNNHNGKLSVYVRMAGFEPPFFVALGSDTFKQLVL